MMIDCRCCCIYSAEHKIGFVDAASGRISTIHVLEHNLLPPPVSVTISPVIIDPLDPTGLEKVCWIVAIYPDQSGRSWRVRVSAPRASTAIETSTATTTEMPTTTESSTPKTTTSISMSATESFEMVEPPIQIGRIMNVPRDRQEATTYAEQAALAAVEAATAPRINALIPFQRRDGSSSVACLVYDSARRAVLAWDLRRSHRQHITIASDATTGCCALEYHSPFVVTWSGRNVHLWHESEIVEELERATHTSKTRPEGVTDLMIPSLKLRTTSPVSTVACNQHVLLIGHQSGVITAWSMPLSSTSAATITNSSNRGGAKELCQLRHLHREAIIELRLLEDCEFACSIAEDRELRLWSLSSGECVCSFKELSGLSARLAPFSLVMCQGQDVVLHDFFNIVPMSNLVSSQQVQQLPRQSATTTTRHEHQTYSAVLSDTDIGGEGDEGGVVLRPSQVPATTITTTLNDFHHESNNNHDHSDELTLSMTMSDCNKELEHEDDELGDEHHMLLLETIVP